MGLWDSLKKAFGSEKLNVAERFEIKRKAVAGTMSSFYLVEERATKKPFGLKIIDMKKLGDVEARFKGLKKPSEGEVAIQFQHPYIVRTYEFGITTKDENYILMEYLAGGGVHTLISNSPEKLDGKRVLYLRQGAEALHEVHKKGFIHRDVCPRNFILSHDGATMKLTDFGLTVPATQNFTQAGNRTGTPNYMAPELVRRKPTNQQLDIFAYGVSAYEIMTGHLPWESGTDGRAALSHDTEPRDIRELRPSIQPALARIIHQCIEPNQSKRFASFEPVLQLLASVKSEDV
ncbi:MAG: serine/threonine-protein kinase [Planctomycetia bacterium]|nr:serine/threonine-protein kinase [Planctomycetia bacterium]